MINLDEGIVVLSLFDGMACGRIALERADIKVKAYYASEIDKPAMKVAKHNWPDIIHIGDVTKVFYCEGWLFTENGEFYVGKIDLLIGGSPCQGFSFAGKQLNFNDPRSKLFFEFVRLREETECEYFFMENVKMKQEFQDVISNKLNVKPIKINSALVSAQNRERLYWTNIGNFQCIKEKNLVIKDILQDDPSTWKNTFPYTRLNVEKKKRSLILLGNTQPSGRGMNGMVYSIEGLAPTLTTNKGEGNKIGMLLVGVAEDVKGHDYNKRVYDINGKSPCLNTSSGGNLEPKIAADEYCYRKITPLEAERLQNVPDNYSNIVSNTQRYKMLGNGWTVDVIVHLFEPLLYVI